MAKEYIGESSVECPECKVKANNVKEENMYYYECPKCKKCSMPYLILD